MKPGKTIDALKNLRLFMQLEDKQNEIKFAEDNYKAIELAIQALEKQIPRKVIDRCMFCECPTCGNVEIQSNSYCCDCGQRLDWSDYNEVD